MKLSIPVCTLALIACYGCDRQNDDRPPEAAQTPATEPQANAPPMARPDQAPPVEQTRKDEREAEGELKSAEGQAVKGEVELEEVENGVKVVLQVEDGPPGTKAVHIHQKADCSDIRGESMGSHFAPENNKHGLPSDNEHHLGDLGNITIGDNGEGRLEIVVPGANLKEGDSHSFLERALVIHEGKDKGVQPSGGAGKPIACAPIEAS